ncbi:BolA family protein [Falsirhodobacter halotolerans]|uniref:BolA family protein n=1 Tax=Falsirhodobacter halotolerans TaxID=1146892 RepID=UPI001FD14200|nr:BolA family protein [Falsirhodobacter halotolerans]MCJ8139394.1 BolA family transcriptional regulator [Falsirhodobacter halotolerans]
MKIADEMERRLIAAFTPTELTVTDESDKHIGHAGYQEGGQSHFHIRVRAAALGDMTRIQRHRAIHAALGDIVPRIHALSLDAGA